MRSLPWVGLGAIGCLALAVGGSILLTDPQASVTIDHAVRWGLRHIPSRSAGGKDSAAPQTAEPFPLFSSRGFETAGFGTAGRYTGTIVDRGSLAQVRAAVKGRAQRGIG